MDIVLWGDEHPTETRSIPTIVAGVTAARDEAVLARTESQASAARAREDAESTLRDRQAVESSRDVVAAGMRVLEASLPTVTDGVQLVREVRDSAVQEINARIGEATEARDTAVAAAAATDADAQAVEAGRQQAV